MPGEARILKEKMTPTGIAQLAADTFGDMIKLVVDVSQGIVAMGGMLHSDAEALLLEEGSSQDDLWGANYFPQKTPGSRLEYTSLINIRPAQDNTDQNIQAEELRAKVRGLVEQWVGPA
jgi:hypothetical protein